MVQVKTAASERRKRGGVTWLAKLHLHYLFLEDSNCALVVAQVVAEGLFASVALLGRDHRVDPCIPCRLPHPGDVDLWQLGDLAILNRAASYAFGAVRHQTRMSNVWLEAQDVPAEESHHVALAESLDDQEILRIDHDECGCL